MTHPKRCRKSIQKTKRQIQTGRKYLQRTHLEQDLHTEQLSYYSIIKSETTQLFKTNKQKLRGHFTENT